MAKVQRRKLLGWGAGLAAGLSTVLSTGKLAAAGLTPNAMEGPYYPRPSMRFADVDNDLVKIAGMVFDAGGAVVDLVV